MPFAHITGWGVAIPTKVLTNDDIAKMVNTNDEWIRSRTGIEERHIAAPEESTASLAVAASLKALDIADISPADVDLIIVSTSSPEHLFPATAALVQDEIGAVKAGAFDLSAACTGFIYAMNMGAQAIRSGALDTVLVIGSETLSRLINWEDRDTCILFGDGAGAFVLQASDQPGGVLSSVMRSDGSGGDLLSVPAGGSKLPTSQQTIDNNLHFIQMNGREVFRFATRVMAQSTREASEQAGFKLKDIDWIIPHQANRRIIEKAARNLKLPMENFIVNLERFGNTSTASIPLATVEALEDKRIARGDKIIFVGFGAGLTWGAVAVEWTGPLAKVEDRKIWPYRFKRIYPTYVHFRSVALRIIRYIEGLIWGRDR